MEKSLPTRQVNLHDLLHRQVVQHAESLGYTVYERHIIVVRSVVREVGAHHEEGFFIQQFANGARQTAALIVRQLADQHLNQLELTEGALQHLQLVFRRMLVPMRRRLLSDCGVSQERFPSRGVNRNSAKWSLIGVNIQ